MSAGRLRHSVVLEQRRQAPTETDMATTYEPYGTAWAEILAQNGAIYAAGVQTSEKVTHRITIRYRPRQEFNHLSKGEQRFRIREKRDPDGRRQWLELLCEEITPGTEE